MAYGKSGAARVKAAENIKNTPPAEDMDDMLAEDMGDMEDTGGGEDFVAMLEGGGEAAPEAAPEMAPLDAASQSRLESIAIGRGKSPEEVAEIVSIVDEFMAAPAPAEDEAPMDEEPLEEMA